MMPPGGGQMPGGGSTTTPTRAEALTDPVAAANAAVKIAQAALAQPTPGSVTQSSNVDSSNISIDQVDITAQYGSGGPSFSVRNGTAWSIGTNDGFLSRISGTTPPWQGAELGKRIAGGTLYVDAYTDIEEPLTRHVDGGAGTQSVSIHRVILTDRSFSRTTLGAGIAEPGVLNGVMGTFSCFGATSFCRVSDGVGVTGDWYFTPDDVRRTARIVGDFRSGDEAFYEGTLRYGQLIGTLNGEQGWFTCLGERNCRHGVATINGVRHSALWGNGWIFVPSRGTQTVSEPDSDYLAGGIWLIAPDDAASAADYQFGAFADGSDPFLQPSLAAVTGTATYTGDATGVYSAKEAGGVTSGYLDADVRLTANFGGANGLGTINGSLASFALDGAPVPGALTLGTANIGAQNSGFFRGTVTGADDQRSYTGHWGGQFFGNGDADGRPGSVAGTFGGHSTDDVVTFVGAFGAHKQ